VLMKMMRKVRRKRKYKFVIMNIIKNFKKSTNIKKGTN